jgi:hypothetical protein
VLTGAPCRQHVGFANRETQVFNPLQLALMNKFGCTNGNMTCELAQQMQPQIMQLILCEITKPGGEITKIGGVTKSRAEWIKALQSVLKMTYEVCETAANSQGPFAMHCHPSQCGDELGCDPRRRYARHMW